MVATQASFDTGYLLAVYMAQLASAGTPPSPADIDEATRLYLTNGAAVTGVPTRGPGAAYFQNGAEVTAVPTTGSGAAYFQNGAAVMAYPSPRATAAQGTTVAAGPAPQPSVSAPEPGVASLSPQSQSGAGTATDLTCSPREIEAAMAFASQFAVAAAPAPPTEPSYTPATAPISVAPSVTPAAGTVPALVKGPFALTPLACPSGPSPWSPYLAAAIGAILGGFAVVLWSRPRVLRVAHRH